LGQFVFFKNYIQRIGGKLFRKLSSSPTKIAIFASGKGSNAENIIRFSKQSELFSVSVVVTNNPGGGIWDVAKKYNVPCILVTNEDLAKADPIEGNLKNHKVEWIVLAGFLKKIPSVLISAFSGKIINIHPALLPEFGGVGMYGNRVHQAVISSGKKESGMTIHWVDEHYDNGDIIFTAKCDVLPNDTPETLETRVRSLEILHYPRVIAECIKKQTVR
jgi:phosphoribosylglycinamide formyltransferase-1